MSLRVLKSDSQGRWRDAEPSWDLLHQRKKQSKNQHSDQDRATDRNTPDGPLYNARGDLVAPVSSLEIDV